LQLKATRWQGDRLHERPVARTTPLPRRSEDPVGDELCRTRAARRRGRAQEPLRQPVGARHAGRGALLLAHRVGEALLRRAARVPAGSHPPGRAESWHGHSCSRPRVTEILREIGGGLATAKIL